MWLHLPTSVYSPEPEDSTSPSDSQFQTLAQFATWRGKSLPPRSWRRVCATAHYMRLLSGVMSPPSTAARGVASWMESLAASRARTSAWPEQEQDLKEVKADSGGSTPESSLRFNLPGCSSKTCLACSRPADRDFDAYAAGLIDGEGSLSVRADMSEKGANCTVVIQVSMASKATAVLNALHRTYGGSINFSDSRKAKESATAKWQMSGVALVCVLKRLEPFLKLKQEQAQICIDLLSTEWQKYNGNSRVSADRLAAFTEAQKKIENLNQRGPTQTPEGYVAQVVGNKWLVKKVSLFGEHWETFSGRFPASGCMLNGVVFERPMLALRTDESGRLSWPTEDWRTPNTRDHHAGGPRLEAEQRQIGLVDQVGTWATPNIPNGGRTLTPEQVAAKGKTENGKRQMGLDQEARNWATPNAHDGRRPGSDATSTQGANLKRDAEQWTTPQAPDSNGGSPDRVGRFGTEHGGRNLADDVTAGGAESASPTPKSRDHRSAEGEAGMRRENPDLNVIACHSFHQDPATTNSGGASSPNSPGSRRRLNPAFGCLLMGLPPWWTNIAWINSGPSGMEWFHSRQRSRLRFLLGERD